MSDAVVTTESVPTNEAGEPDWSKLPDNISGAEASRLMEEYKAKKSGSPVAAPARKTSEETSEKTSDLVKDAAKEAIRRHKVKVDGEEIEIDEEELKRGYSHQRAASKALNEGKALRKQAEQVVAMLKDPDKFFELAEKMGHDTRTLAEKRLAKALEEELLDPKEKELRATKARLTEYERAEEERKERVKTEHMQALEKKIASEYETQFLSALKEESLPATKPMIAEMAKYIGRAASLGFKMTVNEAALLVKEDLKVHQGKIFRDADAETILGVLGEDLANKIRAYDVAKLKSPDQFLKTPEKTSSSPKKKKTEDKSKRGMSAADWAKFIRS